MSQYTVARNFLLRAFFLLSLILCSCAPQSFAIRSAKLYPLYVYDPGNTSTTLFAALKLQFERGSTDLRKIRLEHNGEKLFWEVDLEEDLSALSRVPVEGDHVLPRFAVEESGSEADFFYPWFLSPGENDIPDGIYTLTVWDYSGQSSQTGMRYENLDADAREFLENHLASLNPLSEIEQGSYEVLHLQEGSNPPVFRMNIGEYLLSINDINTLDHFSDELFLWGVPAGIDCLVLAGPY